MRGPRRLAVAGMAWAMVLAVLPAEAQAPLARPKSALPGAKAAAPPAPAAGPSVPLPKPAPQRLARGERSRAAVPLPLPRPEDVGGSPSVAPQDSAPPPAPMEEAAFAACLKDFTARGGEAIAKADPDEPAKGEGACAIPGPVAFSRVTLPEGPAVTLDSAVTVRCTMALELASWIRDDLAAIARRHGTALAQLKGVGGHACRPRNGQAGAQISEHASGNAFDLLGIKLADGRVVEFSQADAATKDIRAEVQKSACERFRTVLGPGADSAHASHVHVDMRQRRNDFRMCQWDVK